MVPPSQKLEPSIFLNLSASYRDILITNSIWNIDYQRQRNEFFGPSDIDICYRQKCTCGDGILLEKPHNLDVYCPQNQLIKSTVIDNYLEGNNSAKPERKGNLLLAICPAGAESLDEEGEIDDEAAKVEDTDDEEEMATTNSGKIEEAMQRS